MGFEDTYVKTLKDWLIEQNANDPPLVGAIGKIKVGKLQESPEEHPATITLHIDDTEDSQYTNDMIVEQERAGGGARHQLLGGYVEMGGGSMWWYRFTLNMRYFFTREGASQEVAQAKASDVMKWLRRRIGAAGPTVLGLATVDQETFIQSKIESWRMAESGGPPASYIWRGQIRFSLLVHVEDY